jgi:hypothetical protein
MARTPIIDDGESLIDDSGTVLWSFIRGEALEFPIVINFLSDCTDASGYVFNAIVVEAENSPNQTEAPDTLQAGGVVTNFNVSPDGGIRLLHAIGSPNWAPATSYDAGDLIYYTSNEKYYTLLSGTDRINATTPDIDPYWLETTKNTVYLRFPDTLGATWAQKPKIGCATYGFFELQVQEPTGFSFRRKWKPVRGMVELLYSPIIQPVE